MLKFIQERLVAAVATADGLSTEITTLLSDGKTLEDEAVVKLHGERVTAYEEVETLRAQLDAETQLHSGAEAARAALETYREPNVQVLNQPLSLGPDGRPLQGQPQETPNYPRPFASLGMQLMDVMRAATVSQISPALAEMQKYQLGLSEGIPSDGGFLVQTDFTTELMRRVHDTGLLVAMPRHIPIGATSNGLKINAVDEDSRVDGSRLGGVQTFWTAEAATITKSKPKFRQIELSLQKLAGLYFATNEELSDTVALEATIAGFFAEEFAFKLDDALIRGTGAGEPLGILGHAGTVDVPKETNQAANTIIKENVEAMYSRMWTRSLRNATWLINQDVWPQLFRLEQAVGTGGIPVFLPAGGLSAAPFGSLMGRPILPIEQAESLGTSGDIILADYDRGYVMIDKGGIDAAVSIHVQFLTDESVFRFIMRTDGQPVANKALTPFKGTKTVSSFITLADRS